MAGQRDAIQPVIRQARVGRAESQRTRTAALRRRYCEDGDAAQDAGIEIERLKGAAEGRVCATARRAPLVAPEGLSGVDAFGFQAAGFAPAAVEKYSC